MIMLHLHVFQWLRSLHTFYFLLKLLTTCEHLLVGNPFYLSNWRMRYTRMTWLLLNSWKVLGIYLQNKNSNSMFLEWHSNTYQGHIRSYMTKTCHICLLLCIEFGQVLWPLLRDVSCSQDQNSRTCPKLLAIPTLGICYIMVSISSK